MSRGGAGGPERAVEPGSEAGDVLDFPHALECPVCFEEYSETKKPVHLDCDHNDKATAVL